MSAITFEDIWVEYEPIVQSCAFEYGGKGHRYGADTDDFRQEFIAWMLDNERMLAGKRAEIEDPDEFGKFLARCLRNEGADYLVDIRDQAGGQPRRGAYWYTTGELKFLLPNMFDPEKWHEPPVTDSSSRGRGIPSQGGNWIATLADVAQAFERLDEDDKDLLRKFHQYGYRNKDMAAADGITEASMSYRHTTVLKRLLKLLGGPRPQKMRPDDKHDPWRGRHAISNAQARAIQTNYWSED